MDGRARPGPKRLMAAGVATSRHCPGSVCQAPKSLPPFTGLFGFPAEAFLLRRVPFRKTFARRLQSCWTSKKVGSACASRFFLDRPASRFLGFHPEGCPPPPRWQCPETFAPEGTAAPGHAHQLPRRPIRTKGNRPV